MKTTPIEVELTPGVTMTLRTSGDPAAAKAWAEKLAELLRPSVEGILIASVLAGCASVPTTSTAAAAVRFISPEQARTCHPVGHLTYDEHIDALGKTPGQFQAIGEASIRNRAAAVDANAVVLTKQETGWFWGNPSFAGDAYRCA